VTNTGRVKTGTLVSFNLSTNNKNINSSALLHWSVTHSLLLLSISIYHFQNS